MLGEERGERARDKERWDERMKEVENDWIRMVRCLSLCPVRASAFHIAPPPPAFLSMMITHQNSISLEDTNNMVTKKLCEPL